MDQEFNYEKLLPMLNPTSIVARGIGFIWSDIRFNVASNNVFYYYIKAPAAKNLIVYNRSFEGAEGPVHLETVVGATFSLESSVLVPGANLFAGLAGHQTEIRSNATSVVGGVSRTVSYNYDAGNKVPVAAPAGLVTIFPPGIEVLLRVTNLSANTNKGITVGLAFAELKIPPHIYQ